MTHGTVPLISEPSPLTNTIRQKNKPTKAPAGPTDIRPLTLRLICKFQGISSTQCIQQRALTSIPVAWSLGRYKLPRLQDGTVLEWFGADLLSDELDSVFVFHPTFNQGQRHQDRSSVGNREATLKLGSRFSPKHCCFDLFFRFYQHVFKKMSEFYHQIV